MNIKVFGVALGIEGLRMGEPGGLRLGCDGARGESIRLEGPGL